MLYVYPKEIKAFVQDHVHEIKTIDPNDLNFNDFEEIGKAIEDAKVVLMGEQDHGDGSTFLAKTRLIKYLHQTKGFDVLVFESDFYGLNRSWELIENEKIPINEYRENIYSLWTFCDACTNLFNYIDSSFEKNDKLIISGNDPRHILGYSKTNFLQDFKKFASENELFDNVDEEELFIKILSELLDKEYESKTNPKLQKAFTSILSKFNQKLSSNDFWAQEMKNLERFALSNWDTLESDNLRDIQMGNNLMWLINEKYKDHKIMVWAHNFHIAKNFNKLENLQYLKKSDTINMGSYVYENIKQKDDLYILGFNSYGGVAGDISNEKFKITKPLPNFFESWVNELDYKFAFLNFKEIPKQYNSDQYGFLMKGIFHSPMKTNWSNVYDGIFYIENMEPCEIINRELKYQ